MHAAAASITVPGRSMRWAIVAMMSVPNIDPAPCAALSNPYPAEPIPKYRSAYTGRSVMYDRPKSVEEGQADQAREHEVVADEAQALDELRENALPVARLGVLADAQAAVQRERGARGDRSQPEPDGSAEGRDQDAGDRRADHPPGLPGDRAERDRIPKPLAVDQLRHERHAARLVERPEGAAQRREHQQVRDADQPEHRQDEGEDQGR